MPLSPEPLSDDLQQFHGSVTRSEIQSLIKNRNVRVLQTSEPAPEKTWRLINDELLAVRPDIEIRIWGHYSHDCDLSVLRFLPNVRNLAVDSLLRATGIEHVGALPSLRSLSVGVFELESFAFLGSVPVSLERIVLQQTRSKKPDLAILRRFTSLKTVYIEGHRKTIEVLESIPTIEDLTLRSVTIKDLAFIRALKRLWSLDIKLGGCNDLSQLRDLDNLKYLELWQISGLSDISVVSTLTGLQSVFLQSLRNIKTIPNLSRLRRLRAVHLENLLGLEDVSGIFTAPALESFVHVCAQNIAPEQYRGLLEMKSLKSAIGGFGSDRTNRAFEEMVAVRGLNRRPGNFQFV